MNASDIYNGYARSMDPADFVKSFGGSIDRAAADVLRWYTQDEGQDAELIDEDGETISPDYLLTLMTDYLNRYGA